jgi:hypothetical protein
MHNNLLVREAELTDRVGTTSMFIDSVCRPNFILKNDPTEEEAFAFGFGVPPFVPTIVCKGPFKLHQVC